MWLSTTPWAGRPAAKVCALPTKGRRAAEDRRIARSTGSTTTAERAPPGRTRTDAAAASGRARRCSTSPATTTWVWPVIPRSDGRRGARPHAGAAARPAPGWSPVPPNCTATWSASWRTSAASRRPWSSPPVTPRTSPPLTALAAHGSLIVSDAGNHASLVDGCRLARGAVQVVGHADPEAVRRRSTRHDGRGPWPSPTRSSRSTATRPRWPASPPPAARRRRPRRGRRPRARGAGRRRARGPSHAAGLAGAPDVVATPTLSKSLGSQGGAVLDPPGSSAPGEHGPYVHLRHGPRAGGARAPPWRACGCCAGSRARQARARAVASANSSPADPPGPTAVRPDAAVVSVRAPSPEAVAVGDGLPDGRPGRGLLPSSFRARRNLTPEAHRPCGPLRGRAGTRCAGDRRDATVSRRDRAVGRL